MKKNTQFAMELVSVPEPFSFRFFRLILDPPGPVGAVWNRTGS